MREKLKNYAPATGTPLVIYAFRRRFDGDSRTEDGLSDAARNEVAYVSSKTDDFD